MRISWGFPIAGRWGAEPSRKGRWKFAIAGRERICLSRPPRSRPASRPSYSRRKGGSWGQSWSDEEGRGGCWSDGPSARHARRDRLLRELLDDLKVMAADLALVLVDRHWDRPPCVLGVESPKVYSRLLDLTCQPRSPLPYR